MVPISFPPPDELRALERLPTGTPYWETVYALAEYR